MLCDCRAKKEIVKLNVEVDECNSKFETIEKKLYEVLQEKNNAQGQTKKAEERLSSATATIKKYVTDAAQRDAVIDELQKKLFRAQHDPMEMAQQVGVSLKSLEKVKRALSRRPLLSNVVVDCSTDKTTRRYLTRVANCITPVVEAVCSRPKFKDNKADVSGVASMVLRKLAHKRTRKVGDVRHTGKRARRKLDFDLHKEFLGRDLVTFLEELAKSWRESFRVGEREVAGRILQLTLAGIPARRGRVSDWLGPMFFNEEVPIESGSNVRLLKDTKAVKFRNRYATTSLGMYLPNMYTSLTFAFTCTLLTQI